MEDTDQIACVNCGNVPQRPRRRITAYEAMMLYGNVYAKYQGYWTCVARQEDDMLRWTMRYICILKHTESETFWGFYYEMGLTERDDNVFPWDNVPPDRMIELFELHPRERVVVEYKRK